MYQSYENVDIFLETFHLYFSSLEAYTTVLRGIAWFCAPPPLQGNIGPPLKKIT